MNIQEALNVFGISGELTEQDIKKTYKCLAIKYHPDKNPLGTEMMKAINAAFDFLMANFEKVNQFQSSNQDDHYNYGEDLERVLTTLNGLAGIILEVIGNWIWISGETKPHKDILKELGCKWANKKKRWFYRPEEHKSHFNRKEHSMEEIREMYGTNGKCNARGPHSVEARI
ncbi:MULTISPECIES: J domain-containing protein [Photorhabdus]|uniref:Molecular chaperone DnaJ n=2 Tax=Photorhabdus TaxID=29487 RepID=A0A7X5QQT0_9GAMM|nr:MULTISPECIES: J domain-containing protein [Photorhabdus]MQL50132.1 DnaJ domain-containing protein [Photorhabdus khanii]NHB98760.1 molecular chaperone DnaJ [Photorhabdus stackebrandtii]